MIDRCDYFEFYDEPRGLLPAKIDDIVSKLCPFMEPNRREFWMNMKANTDVEDLSVVRGFNDNELQDDE